VASNVPYWFIAMHEIALSCAFTLNFAFCSILSPSSGAAAWLPSAGGCDAEFEELVDEAASIEVSAC